MKEEKPVCKKGFTLVEILVAMAIMIIAMASISLSFKGGLTSWTKGNTRMDRYSNARVAMDMMSREISAALIAVSSQYTIDFIGDPTQLYFVASIDNSGTYDLVDIRYYLGDSDGDGKTEIIRDLDTDPDFNFSSNAPRQLALNVTSLGFRYYDAAAGLWDLDNTWYSNEPLENVTGPSGPISPTVLTNDDDKLPSAVEITITVQDEMQREPAQTFSTVVYLPTSR